MMWLSLGAVMFAHDPGLSTATVRLRPDGLDVALVLSAKDAELVVGLNPDQSGRPSPKESAKMEELFRARFVTEPSSAYSYIGLRVALR